MARPAADALYDTGSIAWRMNSQSFVLLGGPRAAILQVCDPGVAAGVAEFSSYRSDPLRRLERTLQAMLAISFGSAERREATLAGLERVHSSVSGDLADGSSYSALDPERQFWVLATLTDTVIEVDRRYLGWMGPAERNAYYSETLRLADAFGIPGSVVPGTYPEFRDYFEQMVATLEPTQESIDITRSLMSPRIRFVPGVAWVPFNVVTTDLLPRRLQHCLGLRDLTTAELAAVRALQVSMRNSVAHVAGAWADNPLLSRAA
ncbi:MAG: DUF2236 domain-containing protein [Actinomycetia bacterium]|nr:DUF2236 domain-containing protein [Actinomycetes bacterium]